MNSVSIVIPLLNEEGSLSLLFERLTETMQSLGRPYEIIFVDDGSTDDSIQILRGIFEADKEHVRVIQFRRNFGKTAALVAGFDLAKNDIVITMDADLQDDPAEIPAMIDKLEEGYDVVAGWRVDRQDRTTKKFSSTLFNTLVRWTTATNFQDLNCGFKVYRCEVVKSIRLYSDMHRLIPILAVAQGFKVVEQPISHHPRHSGRSSYGTRRAARGFIDLLAVLFLTRYARNPLRLFGWIGLLVTGVSFLTLVYLAVLWLLRLLGAADIGPIGTRPLFSVGILGMILGFQLISIGLLAEMIRYYTYRPTEEYAIRTEWTE